MFATIRGFFLICSVVALLVAAAGCYRPVSQPQGQVAEAYVPDSNSVAFDIAPLESGNGASKWMATYTSKGKTAKFRIELGPERTVKSKNAADFSFAVGDGGFVAEPGSDSSVLLADLRKALEAKTEPAKNNKSSTLRFTFVNFGTHLSQASGGGFNAEPAGNWTAMKIFIEGKNDVGEVFLNLNPVMGKGQFSIKDPEYGDIVLRELAKVL